MQKTNHVFRVVKIISDTEIVINAGTADGVDRSTQFEIFVPGKPIIDPETKETLGNLDLIKARLKAKDVFERMCVCVNADSVSFASSLSEGIGVFAPHPKRLNVKATDISGGLPEDSGLIEVGDRVRKSI